MESWNLSTSGVWAHQGTEQHPADTLSHLIDIDPNTQLTLEGKGYEFGYAVFEELPKVKSFEINEVIAGDKEIKSDPDL